MSSLHSVAHWFDTSSSELDPVSSAHSYSPPLLLIVSAVEMLLSVREEDSIQLEPAAAATQRVSNLAEIFFLISLARLGLQPVEFRPYVNIVVPIGLASKMHISC